MNETSPPPEIEAIAQEVLAAFSGVSQIPKFTSRTGGLSLDQAYQVTPRLRAAFEAGGQVVTGRKIGFTNRDMWERFGVVSPVWGYTTSRTTRDLADTLSFSLSPFSEPRIEPEIMFGLRAPPKPGMADLELLDCIDWIALGFEIVQSIYPGWHFGAADTIAANGLHAALLVGQRHEVSPRKDSWLGELGAFTVALSCNGVPVHQGGGALVLGSPLQALRHLVELLAMDRRNPGLHAGEIISTGTLTLAAAVKAGERWTATVAGIPLEDIAIQFE